MNYVMHNSPECKPESDVICATHPAQPGTYLCWPKDEATNFFKEIVILWGVMEHGWLVPITVEGPWGGADDVTPNKFVLHPDGTCSSKDGDFWVNPDVALAFIRQHRPTRKDAQ